MTVTDNLFSSTFKDVVTVVVGEEKERFIVHKDIICKCSKFFTAALSGHGWQEGKTNKIRLPEFDGTAFRTYVLWTYFSPKDLFQLVRDEQARSLLNAPDDELSFGAYDQLFHVWILADFLGDSICKNKVIDDLTTSHALDSSFIQYMYPILDDVYSRTKPGCALRRWIADSMVPHIDEDDFDADFGDYHQDLLRDICKAFVRKRGFGHVSVPRISEAWMYHE